MGKAMTMRDLKAFVEHRITALAESMDIGARRPLAECLRALLDKIEEIEDAQSALQGEYHALREQTQRPR